MNELIRIDNDDKVSGRELHDFLEVGRDFTNWMKQMIGYGFSEHVDYETCSPNLASEKHGGQNKIDYRMTIEMAKEICMIQRTDRGKQARQYFIECEKRLKAVNVPHDSYMISDPVERALKWAEEEKVRQAQVKQLKEQHPKVLFADSVSASKTEILVGELAKLIKQNGVDIGQKRLFDWMREKGYLIKRKGTDWNMPTQKAMDMGLFRIKETSVSHSDGHVTISKTPKVTGKGQIYFVNKLLGGTKELTV
jgi:anti-repressor protein